VVQEAEALSSPVEYAGTESSERPIDTKVPSMHRRSDAGEWQEYLIEAWALGCYMIVVGLVATLLEAPLSPLLSLLPDQTSRRVLMAAVLGVTTSVLIYSPWGKRSGAHMNPAVTLAFMRLGKITARHALGYTLAQLTGATLGIYLVWVVCGRFFSAPPVSFAATVPGERGVILALIAELCMSAALMLTILESASRPRLAAYTGLFTGVLVFVFISLEAPISGTGINPARSVASAIPAHQWTALWIYIFAPLFGMQCAAAFFAFGRAKKQIPCAKLCHSATQRCIHCGFNPT
jgi:aquaporin Z